MRKLLYCLLFLPMGAGLVAQNKTIVFGYEEIPQSLLVNPAADMPQDFHAGIPLLSQFYLHGGASGVSAYDIFQECGYVAANVLCANGRASRNTQIGAHGVTGDSVRGCD